MDESILERNYKRAKEILEGKNKEREDYERVIELLKDCENYKDSSSLIKICEEKLTNYDKYKKKKNIKIIAIATIVILIGLIPLFINIIHYNKAMKLYNNKDYLEAPNIFEKLNGYSNSKDMRNESYIDYVLSLIADSKINSALNYLEYIEDNRGVNKSKKNAYYKLGEYYYNNNEYLNSATYYDKAIDYSDSQEKAYDAKYMYITSHKDKTDETTLEYMKTLRNAKYKDIEKIHNEIYGWTATIVVKDTYGNNLTHGTNLHGYYDIRLTVNGGEPGEKEIFFWYYIDNDGTEKSLNTTCKLKDGESCNLNRFATGSPVRYHYIVYAGSPSNGLKVAELNFKVG